MSSALALDFDGLICDGLNECVLVTWNSHHNRPLNSFSDRGLADIPGDFVERFRAARNFARHLGHFLVPLVDPQPVDSQRRFDATFGELEPAQVEEFVAKATAYRSRVRSARSGAWLGYHTLYPGMREAFGGRSAAPYVVTAKDPESVVAILARHGIVIDADHLYGELRSKVGALDEIAERERVARSDVRFLDDSLANVLDARAAGFEAHWATWGYSAPEHHRLAATERVSAVGLDDLPRLIGTGRR